MSPSLRSYLCTCTLLACGADPDDTTGTTTDVASTADAPTTTTPTPDAPGTTGGPELDPRVADCLRVSACDADGGEPLGMHDCLAHALDLPWQWATTGPRRLGLAALACKLAAPDCEGVRACTPAAAPFAGDCAAHPGADLCAGDTWVYCDDLGAPIAAMTCGAAGLACHQDIWAGCGAEPCSFGVTEPSCDGDTLVECSPAGALTRVDCRTQYNYVIVSGPDKQDMVYAIAGETCGFDEQRGALGCVGTGDACEFFSQKCDGDVLETCAGGKLGRRDCGALDPAGQGCGFIPDGPFAGAAACGLVGSACELADAEACAGDVLEFCDLGVPAAVDCRAHGDGGCATAERGGRTVAYCAP
jgi:hypothetical protein